MTIFSTTCPFQTAFTAHRSRQFTSYTADNLAKEHLNHGFMDRSFNLRDPEQLAARNAVPTQQELTTDSFPPSRLCLLQQVHGCKIVDLRQEKEIETVADGWLAPLVAREIGQQNDALVKPLALGIATADCAPVIVMSKHSVALLHCGWRGTLGHLLVKAIDLLTSEGASPESLVMAVGPSASGHCASGHCASGHCASGHCASGYGASGQCETEHCDSEHCASSAYEIREDLAPLVYNEVERLSAHCRENRNANILAELIPHVIAPLANSSPYQTDSGKTYNFSPPLLLACQAVHCGLSPENISIFPSNTLTDSRFFSHRREKEKAGRQLSYIIRWNGVTFPGGK